MLTIHRFFLYRIDPGQSQKKIKILIQVKLFQKLVFDSIILFLEYAKMYHSFIKDIILITKKLALGANNERSTHSTP